MPDCSHRMWASDRVTPDEYLQGLETIIKVLGETAAEG